MVAVLVIVILLLLAAVIWKRSRREKAEEAEEASAINAVLSSPLYSLDGSGGSGGGTGVIDAWSAGDDAFESVYASADCAHGMVQPRVVSIYEVPSGNNYATPQGEQGEDYRVAMGRAGASNDNYTVPSMGAPIDYAEADQHSCAVDEATYDELGSSLVYASVPPAAKMPNMGATVDYAEADQHSGAVDEATYAELGVPLVYASVPTAAKPAEQQYDTASATAAAAHQYEYGAATAEQLYDVAGAGAGNATGLAQPVYDVAGESQPVVLDGAGDQNYDQATTATATSATAEAQYDQAAAFSSTSATAEAQYDHDVFNGAGDQYYDQAAAATALDTVEPQYDVAAADAADSAPVYDVAEAVAAEAVAADSAQPVVLAGAGDQYYDQAAAATALDTAEPQYDVATAISARSATAGPQNSGAAEPLGEATYEDVTTKAFLKGTLERKMTVGSDGNLRMISVRRKNPLMQDEVYAVVKDTML